MRGPLLGILLTALLLKTVPTEAAVGDVSPDGVSEETTGDTVEESVSEYGQEDYTDTDVRRGILAVRLEAFEGFHGTAELIVRGKENSREWRILLKQETFYQANQELPIGEYRISGILAVSEGRVFDCLAEPEEISLTEGEAAFCQVSVFPGSVYRLPYEEDEPEGASGKEQSGVKTDGEEKRGAGQEKEKTGNEETEERGALETDGGNPEKRIPVAFAAGLAGCIGCAGWIFRLITTKREGGV